MLPDMFDWMRAFFRPFGTREQWIDLAVAVQKYDLDMEKLRVLIESGELKYRERRYQDGRVVPLIENRPLMLNRISGGGLRGLVGQDLNRAIEGVVIGVVSGVGTAMALGGADGPGALVLRAGDLMGELVFPAVLGR